MMASGLSAEDIALKLLDGMEPNILDEAEVFYKCDCSRERTERVLASIGNDELKSLAEEENEIKVCCHFCGKEYKFTPAEALKLRENS
jgi:molecular chaperone Hsp33